MQVVSVDPASCSAQEEWQVSGLSDAGQSSGGQQSSSTAQQVVTHSCSGVHKLLLPGAMEYEELTCVATCSLSHAVLRTCGLHPGDTYSSRQDCKDRQREGLAILRGQICPA